MNNRDQRRYERLTRVQTFGCEHAADFTVGSKAAELFAQLDQRLVELEAAKAGQTPARVDKRSLLRALMTDLRNLQRTARAIELKEPGFAAPYKLPDKAEGPLLTHTDALLQRLEDQPADGADDQAVKDALRARFVAYEIAPDFVAALRRHREAVRAAEQQNQGETQDGVQNTQRIKQLLDAAGDDVQELDAIIANKYAKDASSLRAWRSASRIESAPRRGKKVDSGSEAVPAAVAKPG